MTIRNGVLATVLAVSWSTSACSPSPTVSAPTNTDTNAENTAKSEQTTRTRPGCDTPTLRILSPQDGARVTAPFPITYETECFSVGRDGTIYFTADGIRVDLHPQTSAGTATVPDQPLLSGRRTVTIQLTDTNGQPLKNPQASTVMTIIIEGSRGAR